MQVSESQGMTRRLASTNPSEGHLISKPVKATDAVLGILEVVILDEAESVNS